MNGFVGFIPVIFALVLTIYLRSTWYLTASGNLGNLLRAGLAAMQHLPTLIAWFVLWFISVQVLRIFIGTILSIFLPITFVIFIATIAAFVGGDILVTSGLGWWKTKR
jgi:hypothetical protein